MAHHSVTVAFMIGVGDHKQAPRSKDDVVTPRCRETRLVGDGQLWVGNRHNVNNHKCTANGR